MSDIITATAGSEVQVQDTTEQVEQGDTAQVEQTGKTFTQAQLDEILKDRLGRERQKFDGELKSHPSLSYLEQKAKKLGITIEQLIDNDRKYEEQEAVNELVQRNVPEEYAKEMLENRKFRETYTTEKQQSQTKEKQQKMYTEFLSAYPDIKPEEIPATVWQEVKAGRNLLDAYARHENKTLRDQLNGIHTKDQTVKANLTNAGNSTGSAKAAGAAGSGFISFETFEANKNDQGWVRKNLPKINESRAKW